MTEVPNPLTSYIEDPPAGAPPARSRIALESVDQARAWMCYAAFGGDTEKASIASKVPIPCIGWQRGRAGRIKRRATILCVLRRREEVKSIVDWMDERQGRGWKKRMQFRDGYMNENIPPRWVRGSVYPRQSSVDRLRGYAARFGYGQTAPAPVALAPELAVQLANSLLELLAR
jgi:hypothetical protein